MVIFLGALGACQRQSHGLYADRSIPMVAPAASADTPPRFVGQWAAAPAQCGAPWVMEPGSLHRGGVSCDLGQVDASSAGYSASVVCRGDGPLRAGRVLIVIPDPAHVTSLTVSGGPFGDPVALQRCAAQ